jgi:hypothetical protein
MVGLYLELLTDGPPAIQLHAPITIVDCLSTAAPPAAPLLVAIAQWQLSVAEAAAAPLLADGPLEATVLSSFCAVQNHDTRVFPGR